MKVGTLRASRTRWRRLGEQISTLLLSLVLAVIVWLIAVNQENPIVQRQFNEQIAVSVRGLAAQYQIVQDLSRETVSVTLQGPQNNWESLNVGDFIAFINLAGLGNGTHDVPVTVEVLDPQMSVASVQRAQLRVQIDEIIERTVPVRVDIMDAAAFGYEWQPPIVEPVSVTVRGPETQVNQVVSARAEVFMRNAKSQVERTQPIVVQNSQGQTVPRVESAPTTVQIIVPVEQWPGRKEVAVRVNLNGQPAAGYRLSNVRVNPSTVVLSGAVDVLAEVPGFVETEAISLTGATGELQQRVQLNIPEGVTLFDANVVDVTISIAAIEGGSTARQAPVIQGLGPGLEATVALDMVDVILSGPLPLLESLEPDDIFVILDLSGLVVGNHVVVPRVVVPTGIRAEGVLPQSVEVLVRPSALETPDPLLNGAEGDPRTNLPLEPDDTPDAAAPAGTPAATPDATTSPSQPESPTNAPESNPAMPAP
ncbi:MAG: CdaR family protein [Litorilinea sp.]